MYSSKTTFERTLFTPFSKSFVSPGAVLTFWRDMYRTSADTALWWTEKWMEAPSAFLAWSPARYAEPKPPAKPAAPVIDLAEAVAARAAAELADAAAEVVEIVETVADTAVSVAEDAVAVATVTAETVVEEVLPLDDLTRMVGIGPKLAVGLADRGVTRFAQIAAWTAADLAEIDKALDLKGRAVRDAWVAQAKRFIADPPAA